MQRWQMQGAKARMSELVKQAQRQPQDITVHGKSMAVVVSHRTYDRLTGGRDSLVDFMRNSPLHGSEDLKLDRDPSLTRETEL